MIDGHISHQMEIAWNKLIEGGFWSALGRLLAILLSSFNGLLLARLLSPGELGVYFLITSVTIALTTLGLLGLPQAIVKMISESIGVYQESRAKDAIKKAILISLVGAIVASGLLLLGGGRFIAKIIFDSVLMATLLPWMALLTAFLMFQRIASQIFRGLHDIRNASIFGGVLANTAFFLVLFVFLISGKRPSLKLILVLYSGLLLINALVSFWLIFRKVTDWGGKGDTYSYHEVVSLTAPLWVVSLTALLAENVDLWLVGALLTEQDAGFYGAAMKLALFVDAPLVVINGVIPPIVGEMYAKGYRQSMEQILRVGATMASLPAFALLLLIFIAPSSLLGLAFGPEFQTYENALVLIILSLGKFFSVFVGSAGISLIMSGYQGKMMRITIVVAIFTVGAALLLIGPFGVIGAAAASAGGLVLQNLMMWISIKRVLHIETHASISFIPAILVNLKEYFSKKLAD